MSINPCYCYYTSSDLPQAPKSPWYFSQHNQHVMNMDYLTTTTSSSSPKPSSQFMASEDNMSAITSYDHVEEDHRNEPLFEKPLTPSDVGKLNRLVIPKQHAEKHLPLSGDSVLLSFEDEAGKMWRFRYSYWSSSQSYVLTKGWSRFVKDKQLDAGDIVRFSRSHTDCARLFIGYRRRRNSSSGGLVQENGGGVAAQTSVRGGGWGGALSYSAHQYYAYPSQFQGSSLSAPCQPDQDSCRVHADAEKQTTAASGNSRKLRLFGVNLECELPADDQSEPSTPVDSPVSSHDQSHHHQYYYQYYSNLHNNMDINFSGSGGGGDVYRQR